MADRPTSSTSSPCIAVPCQPATAGPAGVMRTQEGTALDGGRIDIHRRLTLKSVGHYRHCTVTHRLSGRQCSRRGETLGSDVARGAGAAVWAGAGTAAGVGTRVGAGGDRVWLSALHIGGGIPTVTHTPIPTVIRRTLRSWWSTPPRRPLSSKALRLSSPSSSLGITARTPGLLPLRR